MQSKSMSAHHPGSDPNIIQQYALHSEPWWRNIPYNGSPAGQAGNASNLSSSEDRNGSMSNDGQSMSNGRLNEEDDDASKESQNTASSQSVDHGNLKHATSTMTTVHDECLTQPPQPPQLELVGHSIACASNPYQDPYYSSMMAAYGHQALAYPHLMGMHHTRMPLPNEMAQEPVYVNAKQFQGILRRRQARAKAELEKKLVKVRKPYLHESRHQHAMRRPRGTGGRFAKKPDAGGSKNTSGEKAGDSGRVISSLSGSSSGSDPLHSESAEAWMFSRGQREIRISEAKNHFNGGSHYQNHSNMHASMYHSHTGDKGEDGDCSGQQRGIISSNSASQRPLSIQ
ncbi:nuclear transcription factor Y subunit A-1 [Euphorbia lathyris]|uniref:nuclear transcription factor Y subunit A-1 n=1 Tax=Euphorbia lathyris TaxID=212925 RepID=UPI0033137F97